MMFLKVKSGGFQMFKCYLARFEKDIGKSLKYMRSDRGSAFISKEFKTFYNDRGIKRQMYASRTPPKNGIAERIDKSIMDYARKLMMEKNDAPKY